MEDSLLGQPTQGTHTFIMHAWTTHHPPLTRPDLPLPSLPSPGERQKKNRNSKLHPPGPSSRPEPDASARQQPVGRHAHMDWMVHGDDDTRPGRHTYTYITYIPLVAVSSWEQGCLPAGEGEGGLPLSHKKKGEASRPDLLLWQGDDGEMRWHGVPVAC